MIYLEAEESDGTAYRWIVTEDMFDRVTEILGTPDTVRC